MNSFFDKFKKKPATATPPKQKPKKTPKEIATEAGEPWVEVISMDIDPDDVGNGAFELDWNDKFIVNLVRAGYQVKPGEAEELIVDRWFQSVCRNVVMENYEQEQADPDIRNQK
tara:strand:- start:207 stop:548 length:342 start_codon:yes stop_codon:yes gene_type:complete